MKLVRQNYDNLSKKYCFTASYRKLFRAKDVFVLERD